MKKILFFALVAMLGIQSIDAQRKETQKRSPEQIVERLDKKLNLTDEQEKQISDLYKDFFSKEYPRGERRTKMDELNKKISQLLNDEQKAKFEKMKNQQKGNKRQG